MRADPLPQTAFVIDQRKSFRGLWKETMKSGLKLTDKVR
jgi:hypothetical protein